MIENNPSNVSSGFEMLLEEVEAEIDFFTRIGSRAFESRDFRKVDEARTQAEKVTKAMKPILKDVEPRTPCQRSRHAALAQFGPVGAQHHASGGPTQGRFPARHMGNHRHGTQTIGGAQVNIPLSKEQPEKKEL